MNHNAFENEMIDTVNRHAEEKNADTHKSTATSKKSVFTKTDVMNLRRGFKSTVLALFTALEFGLSILTFISVASATGYWAVALFILALGMMVLAFILLYAQGIIQGERQGARK